MPWRQGPTYSVVVNYALLTIKVMGLCTECYELHVIYNIRQLFCSVEAIRCVRLNPRSIQHPELRKY